MIKMVTTMMLMMIDDTVDNDGGWPIVGDVLVVVSRHRKATVLKLIAIEGFHTTSGNDIIWMQGKSRCQIT